MFLRQYFLPGQQDFVQFALQHADAIIAVSTALQQALRGYGTRKDIRVIGNIVDVEFFTLPKDASSSNPFVFSIIGALREIKRHDIVLRAFAHAFREKPIRLNIAGDGRLRRKLQAQVIRLGIQDQVDFLGQLSRASVRELIARSNVVLSASDQETFGITLIEAMACGKPVIATRSGGPEDIVNKLNGLLVPTGDAGALAAAMSQMVSDYNHYDAALIRAECVKKFSEMAIVKQLDAVYREVTI